METMSQLMEFGLEAVEIDLRDSISGDDTTPRAPAHGVGDSENPGDHAFTTGPSLAHKDP